MGKGKGFNGSSKCRNKRVDKEDRRVKYTKTKFTGKVFNRKETARKNLKKLKRVRVEGNGKLVVFKSNDPFAPCLLQHVLVGGKYIDHVWVKFPLEERKKLKLATIGERVHFSAEIHEYYKRYDREVEIKFGLSNIELVKEV